MAMPTGSILYTMSTRTRKIQEMDMQVFPLNTRRPWTRKHVVRVKRQAALELKSDLSPTAVYVISNCSLPCTLVSCDLNYVIGQRISTRAIATFSPSTTISENISQIPRFYILKDTKIPISTSHVSMFLTPRTRTLPIIHLPIRSLILRTPQTRPITSKFTKTIARLKKPSRGGRNLSERYRTLERALRGKEAFARGKEELDHHVPVISISVEDTNPKKESVETIHGFVVPQEPKPPADDGVFLLNPIF
jgi:hypothetical protein